MNVLITSAGRRVSLIREFQTELKFRFPDSKVYAADAAPELAAGCYIADGTIKVPVLTDEHYISFLVKKCKQLDIKIIIPTIDTELEVMAKNMDAFFSADITPIISSSEFIEKCRNKRIIHQFFSDNGIKVAHEYTHDNYQLPLFIKPEDGSRSMNTYIIRDTSDFRDFHFSDKKYMFLEYLDNEIFEEFTCDMYYDRGSRLRCVVPRKRIEVRDGEVTKCLTVKNEIIRLVRENLGIIPGAVGCLTAQFFRNKFTAELFGIEINARFGGGYPLSYLAGANYPAWIIDEYLLNKPIGDQFDCWEENLLMMRYDHEILVHGYKG